MGNDNPAHKFQEALLAIDFEQRWPPFDEYLKVLGEFLVNEQKEQLDAIETDWKSGNIAFPEGWDEEERYRTIYGRMEYIEYIWERSANVFRKSFLIALHASFENFLVEECISYAKVKNKEELDLKGKASLLVKLLGYLGQEGAISPIGGKIRERLQMYTDIRNFIAHADAKLTNWKKDEKRIQDIVKNTDGLEWTECHSGCCELLIGEIYCRQTLEAIQHLAKTVYFNLHGGKV